jgi:hypothetical protein
MCAFLLLFLLSIDHRGFKGGGGGAMRESTTLAQEFQAMPIGTHTKPTCKVLSSLFNITNNIRTLYIERGAYGKQPPSQFFLLLKNFPPP